MSSVQIEQKSYEMPPQGRDQHCIFSHRHGHRAIARYYEKVFGARILSHG